MKPKIANEACVASAQARGGLVRVVWSDGFEASFAALWLIDNAPCGTGAGGHRLATAADLARAGPVQRVEVGGGAVRLILAGGTLAWPAPALRAWARGGEDASQLACEGRTLWTTGEQLAGRPAMPCEAFLADDKALEAGLGEVCRHGLLRLVGAPVDPGTVEVVVARFGFIRETNYGRVFDVRVIPDPNHLAYTAAALEPHTDNPYRDPAPTLQLLHCLKGAADGGATFFLDGFALAEDLRASDPKAFALLSHEAVPFGFTDADGRRYETRAPILRLGPDGEVVGLRFNHRAMGRVEMEGARAAAWYGAYLRFAEAAAAAERHLSLPMKPGDLVLFDNERILHGRDAFAVTSERWLRGCYADRDGLLASLARLRGATT